ncbi:unnamed protein product [Closterium sp. NIES-54]
MAPTPTLNNGNLSNPASDSDRNTRDLAGERRNKRWAEDGPPAPTAVDVLLGGLEVNKQGDAQQHPLAPVAPVVPVAPVAPAAQVAMAVGAAHASDAEHTPATAAGPSRQRQRRRTAVSSSDTTTASALTQALTPDQFNALLSLLQQQPVSVTATETALPAASASAQKENVKREKCTRGARTNRHDNDAATASPSAPAADNDTDDSEDEAGARRCEVVCYDDPYEFAVTDKTITQMRGRLRATFAWWSSWCPCSLVLSVIAKGYWLPRSHSPPQPFHDRNHVGANTHATFTRTAIQELIETRAAVPMPATELTCISPLNVVEKKDKCRLILDLRKVNANLIVPKFKYEGLSRVADLARVGDWMFSIDLKSGYHHMDIHPSCWKFLGFEFDKCTYAFRSLPFGLTTAPFVFTQLIKQLARRWREQGIRIIPYVDDILFLCQSKAHAQAICQRVILDLKEAGFVINAKKSQLPPSQRLRFLGV